MRIELGSPAQHINSRGIWSPNVGGSVNFVASTETNPFSADTNLLRKNQNLQKRHQMVVKLNKNLRKRRGKRKKQKELQN